MRLAAISVVVVLLSTLAVSVSASTPYSPARYPIFLGEDQMPGYALKWGTLPYFRTEAEAEAWLLKLEALAQTLDGPDVPLWGDIVVAHGAGADGYYWVFVAPDRTVTGTNVSTIAAKINLVARQIGFASEVPVKFTLGWGVAQLDAARTTKWRPIIGGVQVRDYDNNCAVTSTLGYSAKRSGVLGYVVTGHAGANVGCTTRRATPVGITMYQPDTPDSAGTVGQVTGGDYADVAWVPFNNIAAQVYVGGSGFSIHFYQDAAVGDTVYMSGLASDTVSGVVKFVYVDCSACHPIFGAMFDQDLATYSSLTGDSGAPVYIAVSGYGRGIVGIYWGSWTYQGTEYSIFSPQSGVTTEVGAVPLTIYG